MTDDARFMCTRCKWTGTLDEVVRNSWNDYCPRCSAKDSLERLAVVNPNA